MANVQQMGEERIENGDLNAMGCDMISAKILLKICNFLGNKHF